MLSSSNKARSENDYPRPQLTPSIRGLSRARLLTLLIMLLLLLQTSWSHFFFMLSLLPRSLQFQIRSKKRFVATSIIDPFDKPELKTKPARGSSNERTSNPESSSNRIGQQRWMVTATNVRIDRSPEIGLGKQSYASTATRSCGAETERDMVSVWVSVLVSITILVSITVLVAVLV